MIGAVKLCVQTQQFEMTGADLIEFRATQAGEYKARNGQICQGWTQAQAAEWIGVTERTWQRWEAKAPPRWAVKRIVDYSMSLNTVIQRVLA